MRCAAGPDKTLLEFGLRRAQGPDGAVSATKYAYLGGFDGTSNVLAGRLSGVHARGTLAHAYVMCYGSLSELGNKLLKKSDGSEEVDFIALVKDKLSKLPFSHGANEGELAAFISYAQAFPAGFLALVDTYETLHRYATCLCLLL